MLPAESSLTYASDLAKHYREIDARFWPPPPRRQPPPPPPIEAAPEPEPVSRRVEASWAEFFDNELDKFEPDHREQIVNRHPCRRIIDEVCAEFGVLPADLIEHKPGSRAAALVRVRQLAMWRCRTGTGLSLPEIGRHFRRDHATVLYAVRKIERERNQQEAINGG